jgi:5-methylcytosine-specific restriction endonuclease McrA
MPKETYYFSHDYHARYDVKAKLLCKEYGAAGYGIYWIIVEMMHESSDNEVMIDDLFLMDLATDYKVDFDIIKKMLDDCVNKYRLFSKDGEKIKSERVKKNKQHRQDLKIKRSEAGRKGAEKKWEKADTSKFGETRKARLERAAKIGTHIQAEWEEMLNYFSCECVKCESTEDISKDHITPIFMGGSDDISNIQPLCRKCNSAKGTDYTDYRIAWCAKKNTDLPAAWMANANGKMANDGKGKESKGNERKEIVVSGGENWHFSKIDGVAIQLLTYRPDLTPEQATMEAKICLDKTGGNASASYIAEYARRISKAQRFVIMRTPFGQEIKWTEEDFEKRKATTEYKFVRYEMAGIRN